MSYIYTANVATSALVTDLAAIEAAIVAARTAGTSTDTEIALRKLQELTDALVTLKL